MHPISTMLPAAQGIDKSVRRTARHGRASALAGCCWVALLAGFSARAQPVPAAATAPARAEPTGKIEQIVVTALRRRQSLQKTPVSVTAVSGAALTQQHIENVVGLERISTSIKFTQQNNAAESANIIIRGIGTIGEQRAFEGSVGVFVDGVYRTRSGQALTEFLDVDSLQVLKGPQGTLFGKATTAGAILVTSNPPNFDRISGAYEAGLGNYDEREARLSVNAPISDKVAVRIAGLYTDMNGYYEDPVKHRSENDSHPRAIKAQIEYKPNEDLTFRLIGDLSYEHEHCCYGAVQIQAGPVAPLIAFLAKQIGSQPPSSNPYSYDSPQNVVANQVVRDQGLTLQTNWNTPWGGALHSITALRSYLIAQTGPNGGGDADFTGADIVNIDNTFKSTDVSQEVTYDGKFNLNGPITSLDYVAGLYYAHENLNAVYDIFWGSQAQTYFNLLLGGLGLPAGYAHAPYGRYDEELYSGTDSSYAGYTHWDAHIGAKLNVFAGIRYSVEQKRGAFHYGYLDADPQAAFEVLGAAPGVAFNDTHDDHAVSGTIGVQYQFSPDVMTYLSYSRGFKAGGINLDRSATGGVAHNPALTPGAKPLDPRYNPEFIDGFEAGLKSDYLDHMARTNVAVFYDRISDLQVAEFLGLNYQVLNIPTATVFGAEIENNFQVTNDIRLNAAATYLPTANFGHSDLLANFLQGRRFSQAPLFTANLGADYEHPISNDYAIIGNVSVQFTGRTYIDTVTDFGQSPVTLLNASIGLKSLARGWTLEGWCLNCANKRYLSVSFASPLQTGSEDAFVAPPATYGIRVKGTF